MRDAPTLSVCRDCGGDSLTHAKPGGIGLGGCVTCLGTGLILNE